MKQSHNTVEVFDELILKDKIPLGDQPAVNVNVLPGKKKLSKTQKVETLVNAFKTVAEELGFTDAVDVYVNVSIV